MLRYGAPPSQSREMDINDLFIARLELMIVSAEACLEGWFLGDHRRRAMIENARLVEDECIELGEFFDNRDRYPRKRPQPDGLDQVFYWRANQLAVMVKAVAQGYVMKAYQMQEMADHIDYLRRKLGVAIRPIGEWSFKDP